MHSRHKKFKKKSSHVFYYKNEAKQSSFSKTLIHILIIKGTHKKHFFPLYWECGEDRTLLLIKKINVLEIGVASCKEVCLSFLTL